MTETSNDTPESQERPFPAVSGPSPEIADPNDEDDEDEEIALPPDAASLIEAAARRSSGKRQQDAHEAYSLAFSQENLTFDDVGPFFAVAAYRLTRMRLFLAGRLALDEDIAEVDLPWDEPCSIKSVEHLKPAEKVIFRQSLAEMARKPVPLDPFSAKNGTFDAWIAQTRMIAEELNIGRPSVTFPFVSPRVTKTLLKKDKIPRIWPNPRSIYEFNDKLLMETFVKLVEKGHEETLRSLMNEFGFTFVEAYSLVRCSKRIGPKITAGTVEEERSLNALRAELTHKRSVAALDPRGQIVAIKHLAIIQGLGRAEPEDAQLEFRNLVAKVSRADPPPTRPVLTTTATPVEPTS